MNLVEDLDINDEFILVSPKMKMKKILASLIVAPSVACLVEDPKSGEIIGVIDDEFVQRMTAEGKKVNKGKAQAWMETNILVIIDKTPLERLPQLLPKVQPDAVVVTDVSGAFKGYLSPDDFYDALASIKVEAPVEKTPVSYDNVADITADKIDAKKSAFTKVQDS